MVYKRFWQRRLSSIVWIVVFIGLAMSVGSVGRLKARVFWQQKVDPWVLDEIAERGQSEFLILVAEQADLDAAADIENKAQKGAYVYGQLTAVARQTQPEIIAALQQTGAEYRSFWVSNMIWVRADAPVVERMARRDDVTRILANPRVKLDVMEPFNMAEEESGVDSIEWNIALVKAPDVWDFGFLGEGAVVGGQDTGYDWQHPALIEQYQGWNGTTADHNYNWHDAIHENNPNTAPGNPCGFNSPQPCDDHGHGTHTMGTMVGDDGGTHQIGMAPQAKWIACRNMEQGWGTPATYAECYEWFIAPYPTGGDPFTDGDPSKAPHVISNSWSCPAIEGCTDPAILRQVVENVRAAGILTAQSASNDGPSCGSITDPAAIYDASFTVGATDINDALAGFSSRGPVSVGEDTPFKPDISAPGVAVNSSVPGDRYVPLNGTSMASPHIAGLVALLISANPMLAGDVDRLENVMRMTAVPLTSSQGCGGDTPDAVPNHAYGWGRIDALAAFQAIYPPSYQFFAPILFGV